MGGRKFRLYTAFDVRDSETVVRFEGTEKFHTADPELNIKKKRFYLFFGVQNVRKERKANSHEQIPIH